MNRLLLGASLLLTSIGIAQISTDILPYSSENQMVGMAIDHRTLPSLDLEEAMRLDAESNVENRAGRILNVNFSLENSGTWTDLSDGGRLWELKITAPNSLAVNLYFSQYELPEGATLHIYNADKSDYFGAFTSKNNKNHGRFASQNHHAEKSKKSRLCNRRCGWYSRKSCLCNYGCGGQTQHHQIAKRLHIERKLHRTTLS